MLLALAPAPPPPPPPPPLPSLSQGPTTLPLHQLNASTWAPSRLLKWCIFRSLGQGNCTCDLERRLSCSAALLHLALNVGHFSSWSKSSPWPSALSPRPQSHPPSPSDLTHTLIYIYMSLWSHSSSWALSLIPSPQSYPLALLIYHIYVTLIRRFFRIATGVLPTRSVLGDSQVAHF